MRYLMAETMVPEEFKRDKRFVENCYVFTRYCDHCGAELYGEFKYIENNYDVYSYCDMTEAERKKVRDSKAQAEADYIKAKDIKKCPVCGAALREELGCFLPHSKDIVWEMRSRQEGIKYYDDPCPNKYFGDTPQEIVEGMIKFMASQREPAERDLVQNQVQKTVKSVEKSGVLSMISNASFAERIRNSPEELKKYILSLIRLENNIYALEQRLFSLSWRRLYNDRAVSASDYEIALKKKTEREEKLAKLEELRHAYAVAKNAHQKVLNEVVVARTKRIDVPVSYPDKPIEPVLGKPGLFNKKKVLEENAALISKYEADMEAYRQEVRHCDAQKNRLIDEKRAVLIAEVQRKAETDPSKEVLDDIERLLQEKTAEYERFMDDNTSNQETPPAPAIIIKDMLNREIADTEELLEKTFAARNEMYACDVVFGKYRNAVALSSFYEYLLSGRCTSLEGADGAYNIYENEIRMNRVISQLDTVIASLEEIKQNQYMMYEELNSINESLDMLNSTMNQALESIQNIDANTKGLAEKTRVIAHNTAVAAYYSKVNADLTNALGFMVALK